MKAYLMYADQDFRITGVPKPGQTGVVPDLIQDLELDTLWDGMAQGDEFLRQVAQGAMLSSLTSIEQIRFRQHVLADCLAHPDIVREVYDLAVQAIVAEHKIFSPFGASRGESLLRHSIEVIQALIGMLRRLQQLAQENTDTFASDGFRRFFAQLRAELDDAYFTEIEAHLKALRFNEGVVLSARLGDGNRGAGHVLRSPKPENRGPWYNRTVLKKPTYAFTIPPRDEAGFRALGELRDRGLNLVATALGHSADHVLSFFVALRTELGFYVGALNLHEQLAGKQAPVCYPDPVPAGELVMHAGDLYDPCLSLRMTQRAVGNTLSADGKDLLIITGANQGGKSTFLRSLGLAHLMMQAGLFVAAESFASTVTLGVFTHYLREEDASMSGGKFDVELARMSTIADAIGPNCLLMCNESFAATNEREGSDIAAEVIRAMNDADIRVVYVTHMYDLAHRYEDEHTANTLFLRADRAEDGQRSFQLIEAPPLPTSFGEDLYRRTFHTDQTTAPDPTGVATGPSPTPSDTAGTAQDETPVAQPDRQTTPSARGQVEAAAVGVLPAEVASTSDAEQESEAAGPRHRRT